MIYRDTYIVEMSSSITMRFSGRIARPSLKTSRLTCNSDVGCFPECFFYSFFFNRDYKNVIYSTSVTRPRDVKQLRVNLKRHRIDASTFLFVIRRHVLVYSFIISLSCRASGAHRRRLRSLRRRRFGRVGLL